MVIYLRKINLSNIFNIKNNNPILDNYYYSIKDFNLRIKNQYRLGYFYSSINSFKDILLMRIFQDSLSLLTYKRFLKDMNTKKQLYKKIRDRFGIAYYLIYFGLIIFIPLLLSVASHLIFVIDKISLLPYFNIFIFYSFSISFFTSYFNSFNALRALLLAIVIGTIFSFNLFIFTKIINLYLGV